MFVVRPRMSHSLYIYGVKSGQRTSRIVWLTGVDKPHRARPIFACASDTSRAYIRALSLSHRRCQVVVAPLMMVSSISVGVCPFKTSRGRRLSRPRAAWTWVSVTLLKSVPLGKYSRIRPPVFSLVGR